MFYCSSPCAATVEILVRGILALRSSSSSSWCSKSCSRTSFCVQRRTRKKLVASSFGTLALKLVQLTKSPSCTKFGYCPKEFVHCGRSMGVSPDFTSTTEGGTGVAKSEWAGTGEDIGAAFVDLVRKLPDLADPVLYGFWLGVQVPVGHCRCEVGAVSKLFDVDVEILPRDVHVFFLDELLFVLAVCASANEPNRHVFTPSGTTVFTPSL